MSNKEYREPLLIPMTDKDAGRVILCVGMARAMIMETTKSLDTLKELNELEESLKKSMAFALQAREMAETADKSFTWKVDNDDASIRSRNDDSDHVLRGNIDGQAPEKGHGRKPDLGVSCDSRAAKNSDKPED